MLSRGLLRSVVMNVKTQSLLNEPAVLSDLCRILAFHWEVGSNRYRHVCNFPSFRRCSWCLSDFTDKKPYCFSTANLSQAAASKNWLVSMPLLRYLRAATQLPKDGANFSWQHNAAAADSAGTIHLTELQTNPLPRLSPPEKNYPSSAQQWYSSKAGLQRW